MKVFDWLMTMFRGRIVFKPPMLYMIGFLVLFVIGGLSGVLLALPPVDYLVHNTTFLVAHFHNVIIPGVLFGYLAGYMLWFPKAFGFKLNEKWGAWSFWCWTIAFILANLSQRKAAEIAGSLGDDQQKEAFYCHHDELLH